MNNFEIKREYVKIVQNKVQVVRKDETNGNDTMVSWTYGLS